MSNPLDAIRSTLLGADAAAPAARPDVPAATLRADAGSRYQHLAVLGAGGMGRVERALDRDLRRDVAVKLLRAELRDDRALSEQFLWEARVTAHLDHPNIVPIHDLLATDDGDLCFTMKLVRGRTLAELIGELDGGGADAMPLARRLRLFLPICHAVGFAHSRGVLHRDLKPGNVMVGEFGEVLVTDWGLAEPLPGPAGDVIRPLAPVDPRMHSAGTPAYMSPEQARGGDLDARSDIYALGALLYELVALRPPVEGATVSQIVSKAAAGEVAPLDEVCPEAPAGLAAVVAQAMAPDRDARYADAAALAADIETVLDGRAPRAEHASPLTRFGRYYLGRDPAMRAMRIVDVDMWIGSAALLGAGVGVRTAGWIVGWWWALVVAAGLVAIPPSVRFLRLRRGG